MFEKGEIEKRETMVPYCNEINGYMFFKYLLIATNIENQPWLTC